jgi:hypothetical protein
MLVFRVYVSVRLIIKLRLKLKNIKKMRLGLGAAPHNHCACMEALSPHSMNIKRVKQMFEPHFNLLSFRC